MAEYRFLPRLRSTMHSTTTTTTTATRRRCNVHFFDFFTAQTCWFNATGNTRYTTLFGKQWNSSPGLPLARVELTLFAFAHGVFVHYPSVAHEQVHLSFLIAAAPRQIMITLISFDSRLPRPWLRYIRGSSSSAKAGSAR